MDITGEIEFLERILATMRDRIARGDARARVIAGVIEQMMAEREELLAGHLEAGPGRQKGRRHPL